MALPAACTIAGNPDMYGLGIRTAFYLDWFAALIVERVNEQHTQILRGAELVLASAVFLGLAIAATAGRLHAVEVYIALLLVSGTVYLLAPRHATDLAVWTRPELYPGYQGRGFGIAAVIRCLFIVVVISLHMWFWVTGVDSASIDRQLRAPYENGCRRLRQVGFAFAPVELRSGWFRALNVLLMSALLAGGVLIGGVKAGLMKKGRSRRRHRANTLRLAILRDIETVGGLALASILVAAIELTIQWNEIPAAMVNQASTAAQMIPQLLVGGLIFVFLYDAARNGPGKDKRSNGGSSSSSGTTNSTNIHSTRAHASSSSSSSRLGVRYTRRLRHWYPPAPQPPPPTRTSSASAPIIVDVAPGRPARSLGSRSPRSSA